MGFFSTVLNSLLGLFIPGYSLLSTIVKIITSKSSDMIQIATSAIAGLINPAIGSLVDVVGEFIKSKSIGAQTAEILKSGSINKLQFQKCHICGGDASDGFYNSRDQRLCRRCFERLSSKIVCYSEQPLECNVCGKYIKEYYLENEKVFCQKCFVESIMDFKAGNNNLIIINENNLSKSAEEYVSTNYVQNYIKNYSGKYHTPHYDKKYHKGY